MRFDCKEPQSPRPAVDIGIKPERALREPYASEDMGLCPAEGVRHTHRAYTGALQTQLAVSNEGISRYREGRNRGNQPEGDLMVG